MTTISSLDHSPFSLKNLVGDAELTAPVEGVWTNVSPKVFEEQVRKMAYGLMVKDFRRGDTVVFTGCTEEMNTFISTACTLAHIKAEFSTPAEGRNIVPASDLEYLISIGGVWSRKYKGTVDRNIARLIVGC